MAHCVDFKITYASTKLKQNPQLDLFFLVSDESLANTRHVAGRSACRVRHMTTVIHVHSTTKTNGACVLGHVAACRNWALLHVVL